MPDNADNISAGESRSVAAGRQLRAAREAAGLSVTEVNARIHLTREVVAALEAGEFVQIAAPVFVRGHLRSYARLLGVPEQEILAACPDAETEAEVFKTQSALQEYRPGFSIVNAVLLAALALLLLIAIIYWLAGDAAESAQNGAISRPTGSQVVSPVTQSGNNTARFTQYPSDLTLQA